MSEPQWEKITERTYRMKIVGGYLYRYDHWVKTGTDYYGADVGHTVNSSMCFVEDKIDLEMLEALKVSYDELCHLAHYEREDAISKIIEQVGKAIRKAEGKE